MLLNHKRYEQILFILQAQFIIMYLMLIGLGIGLILAIQIYFGNQNGISFMNQMTYILSMFQALAAS